MDSKIFKKELPGDPSEQDYLYWKSMLSIYITKAEVPDDDKLQVLFSLCGPAAFPIVEDCDTYDLAIARLDSRYTKTISPIMMRHKLRNRKQSPDESVDEFMRGLESIVKKIPTPALTADQHRSLLLTDAFVSGLNSMTVRQRLLESKDSTLRDLLQIAASMELAIGDAKNVYNSPVPEPPAVASVRSKCFWCGGQRHKRSTCPARHATCGKCGKVGHWQSVCLSGNKTKNKISGIKTAAIVPSGSTQSTPSSNAEEEDSESEFTLSQLSAVCAVTNKSSRLIKGQLDSNDVEVLIDTGSDISFIQAKVLADNKLNYRRTNNRTIVLADNTTSIVVGEYFGELKINDQVYMTELCVVSNLVAPIIVGMDLLRQHSHLVLTLGGPEPPAEFCLAVSAMHSVEYELLPGINTSKLKPIATPSRRGRDKDQAFISQEIERLLEKGIIQESRSPWRAQCFVTRTENHKPRLVIDYSETINIYTPADAYPMPRIDDLLHKVARNKVFSKIDLRNAYHQVPLKPSDCALTAFEACGKLYEFTKLPFGCSNAVPIFQRIMDNFIKEHHLKETYSYIDDTIIGGETTEEHDEALKNFRKAAGQFGLEINEEKCQFGTTKISFLGHVIENGTIKPDPQRFEPLLNFPAPSTPKELNRLLGLFAYYAKWIPQCSELTQPLRDAREVLTRGKPLPEPAKEAIDKLKLSLANACLAVPDQSIPLSVETDASDVGLGATLLQQGKPVAFFSRTLTQSERKQSTVEKEACAIVESCRRWRHLLHSVPKFDIITDQKSVSYLYGPNKRSKIKNEKIQRWRIELAEFHFDICYRSGIKNIVADAMSRCAQTVDHSFLDKLHQTLCHPGVRRFYHYCRSRNIPVSVQEVRRIVTNCSTCRECKPRYYKPPPGILIQATRAWERLSVDFIGPLPSSTRNRYILTVVDEYSRYPFAFPCSDMSAEIVAKHLFELFSMFGAPGSIHSDRGTQFESKALRQFLARNGVMKTRTTPYHPEGNAQCERVNGTILRTVNLALKNEGLSKLQWESVLPRALASIRALLCTATNMTPHDRLFKFQRSSAYGTVIPEFLQHPGAQILHKLHVRSKNDPLVEQVTLLDTISPYFARVEYKDGRTDTVSTRHLAPSGQEPVGEICVESQSSRRPVDDGELQDTEPITFEQLSAPQLNTNEQALRRSTRVKKPPERLNL